MLQSFFTSMTTNLCEALVCGKDKEAMFLIDCPIVFVSSYFSDLFRALIARNVRTLIASSPLHLLCPPSCLLRDTQCPHT